MKLKLSKLPRNWTALFAGIAVLLAAGVFFILRWLRDSGFLLAASGASAPSQGCVGIPKAPPTIYNERIISSITPTDKLTVGDHLRVTARVAGNPAPGEVRLISDVLLGIYDSHVIWVHAVPGEGRLVPDTQHEFLLYDDGTHGDVIANDKNWTLDLPWEEKYGTKKMRLHVQLQYSGCEPVDGPETELTILPKGEADSNSHPAEPK